MAANTNGVAAGSHDNHDVLNKISEISDVNIMFESEPRVTERGSPSLVGRGIANPMSERTRGFELPINGTKFPLPALFLLLLLLLWRLPAATPQLLAATPAMI